MIGLSTQPEGLLFSLHATSAQVAFCFVFLGNYMFISDQNVIAENSINRNCIFSSPWESKQLHVRLFPVCLKYPTY